MIDSVDFSRIKMLISDVDGVLTNGHVYSGAISETEEVELKQFSIHDGMGVALARAAGLPIALISGRYSPATDKRASELKIEEVYNGALNKLIPYEELKEKYNLSDVEIAYIGDDLIDIPVMVRVGLPVAVKDAFPEVKDCAVYVTDTAGGEGALREVVVKILKEQGRYEDVLSDLRNRVFENPDLDR